jgi:hypothetical protein
MLTEAQRAELKELGAPNVRSHLLLWGAGRGASVGGFRHGNIDRGDINDWLAEQYRHEASRQWRTLFWAVIGGVAGMMSVGLTIWFALR